MPRFDDLDEFLDDTIELPGGNGKVYRISSPDVELGLWVQRVLSAQITAAKGGPVSAVPDLRNIDGTVITAVDGVIPQDEALYQRLLGPVWGELKADQVPWNRIQLIAQTAMFWVGTGLDTALAFWKAGGRPGEAPAPNRQARRAKSTSTAGASTTKPRASTSGTKSRLTAGKR